VLDSDLTITASDGSANLDMNGCSVGGVTTFTGGSQRITACAFEDDFTLNSVVGTANCPCFLIGCQVEGAVEIIAPLLADSATLNTSGSIFATVAETQSVLTINGLGAFVRVSDASLPLRTNVVFAGGATSANLLYFSDALALGYTPVTPADWSVVPVNVQEALDTLAAAAAGSGTWERETFVIAAPDIVNGYLDLANTAIDDSVNPIVQGSGPLIGGSIAGGDDYEMSVVGPITRVTFSAAVVAAWVVGQRVQIQYQF